MFYPQALLERRGPLGRVWTAAHMERKLSKSQTLQTDIEESVDAIVENKIEVLALRVSGQLLLGVVRIYSRKAKYLLDDCNEAFAKIKLAFRPGIVDLAEDQLTVNRTAITLQTTGLGLDMLLPDANWDIDFEGRQTQSHGHQHQAHVDDITLRTLDDFQQLDLADPFDIGPADGIGSQDFQEVDLGIHWDDDAAQAEALDKSDIFSTGESVGVGRHAPRMSSVNLDLNLKDNFHDDILSHGPFSREASEAPFGNPMDVDIPDINLEDLGIGFDAMPVDEIAPTPGQTRESSRASSPLTELPPTPPPMEDVPEVPNPDTAQEKVKRKMKDKRQIIDSVTEIDGGRNAFNNAANVDVSSITTEQRFLPRSAVVMRLMEIRDDPIAHFLPIRNTPNGQLFYASPPGLSPELADLFARPIQATTAQKRKALSPGPSPTKRARADEIEQLRKRTSVPPDVGQDSMFIDHATPPLQDFEFPDQSGVVEDFQLDLPEVELNVGPNERAKSVASDRSRFTTPGLDEGEMPLSDATCPIAIFDARHPSHNEQSQDGAEPDEHGYSKNTVKALGLIRKELRRNGDAEQPLSFNELSQKASKRAASSFFFELLFLGTRDCLKLTQKKPFENIEVTGKPRLWEYQQPSQADVDPELLRELEP